ncbi:MAG: hypothetical protein GWN58_01820 [Anaerolineae bacterium]|nr:hypothetical protein [Anaerolineae bacterium]
MKRARMEHIKLCVKQCRARLEEHPDEPALALMEILDLPELEDSQLARLTYLLWTERYGCHKNDVTGVLDLLDEWLDEQEVEEDASPDEAVD